ncbi:hypothetical protein Cfor_04502, partial [Coptotermes formosanus]
MALMNFSVPYAHTASPTGPYLAAAASANAFSSLNSADVNSLIYSQSLHQQQIAAEQAYRNNGPLPPSAPNRRTTTASRRQSNDHYSKQPPPIQEQQSQQRSPRYYNNDNYRSSNTARHPEQSTSSPTGKGEYPSRPSGYTRIENKEYRNQPGTKTSLHAVLDYDDDFDDYSYEDDDVNVPTTYQNAHYPAVTPIQGPIFIKNGSVPVVPLYSYPVLNNGTFVQIP